MAHTVGGSKFDPKRISALVKTSGCDCEKIIPLPPGSQTCANGLDPVESSSQRMSVFIYCMTLKTFLIRTMLPAEF